MIKVDEIKLNKYKIFKLISCLLISCNSNFTRSFVSSNTQNTLGIFWNLRDVYIHARKRNSQKYKYSIIGNQIITS